MVRRYRQSVTVKNKMKLKKDVKHMERVYKTMRNTGAGCIAVGIIIAVTGLTVGIISIVNGSLLLKRKSELEF